MWQSIYFMRWIIYSYFLRSPNPTEHQARIDKVTLEITLTGSYSLTTDELTFGAKQAWRNAPRCIARIQWANLQVWYFSRRFWLALLHPCYVFIYTNICFLSAAFRCASVQDHRGHVSCLVCSYQVCHKWRKLEVRFIYLGCNSNHQFCH